MALLAQGNMEMGWEEYEWRWKTRHLLSEQRKFSQPQWHGERADGQTLLIHAEQGFGDTLQFCRYAPLAAARGLRVILEVQKPLLRLLRGLPGIDLVIAHGDQLPPFDLHSPLLSLPRAFGTRLESIPNEVPYLHAEAVAAAHWRTRLDQIANQGPKIGIVWAGRPYNHSSSLMAIDRRRSMSPEFLAPLFEISGLKFFSLQKSGPGASGAFPLIDLMKEVDDFADTAALVTNLDLVISVDTAVAHLAAALGKQVWLMNRFDSCWRWLEERRDSPWYPTLRLYRQSQPGAWGSVINEIGCDLRNFVTSHGSSKTAPPLHRL
ncbi:MAG TPA: glycosyltransferase family 9 protein [Acidocella sp.]|nr:glycosyltransferase family 9 protein [Acidocella sp.]